MTYDYDVVCLGSGHSCWHGALILAAAGKKVILMEKVGIMATPLERPWEE